MKILILGEGEIASGWAQKFNSSHQVEVLPDYRQAAAHLETAVVVFDFLLADQPEGWRVYPDRDSLSVFSSVVHQSLREMVLDWGKTPAFALYNFNSWLPPEDKPVLEVSALNEGGGRKLAQVMADLGVDYALVADRVGLVTPRVLAMIINEAFYTLQEQVAGVTDINLAMQLGTNYPDGPFGWAEKIGLHRVYRLLRALYEDTQDGRYKICPLLKQQYLAATLN